MKLSKARSSSPTVFSRSLLSRLTTSTVPLTSTIIFSSNPSTFLLLLNIESPSRRLRTKYIRSRHGSTHSETPLLTTSSASPTPFSHLLTPLSPTSSASHSRITSLHSPVQIRCHISVLRSPLGSCCLILSLTLFRYRLGRSNATLISCESCDSICTR